MPQHVISPDRPEQFFADALTDALDRERVTVSQDAVAYVVFLLADLQRSSCHPDDVLAEDYARAFASHRAPQAVVLRSVGDRALLFSGLWWERERSRHGGPQVRYHMDLGRTAYRTVGGVPFIELADRFGGVVDALMRLASTHLLTSDPGLLRLYDLWSETRSTRAARLLAERGMLVGAEIPSARS